MDSSERHKPLKKRRQMTVTEPPVENDEEEPPKLRRMALPPRSAEQRLSDLVAARRHDQFEEINEERDILTGATTNYESEPDEDEDQVDEGIHSEDGDLSDVPANMGAPSSSRVANQRQAQLDQPFQSNKAMQMMQKMGYKEGKGLGTRGEGRLDPIELSTQHQRRGLGAVVDESLAKDYSAKWDDTQEAKTVEELPVFIDCPEDVRDAFVEQLQEVGEDWMIIDKEKMIIDDETEFCSPEILSDMLKAKQVFDSLPDRELREARTRANPYESIGSAFFQNRAAMKTANLDRILNWMLIREDPDRVERKNPMTIEPDGAHQGGENVDRELPLFYFADVCAGPGGFTEYMLWRKGFYNAKGFGFTLKGKDDFKLERFSASAPEFFEPFYVNKEDKSDRNDVTKPGNLLALEDFIQKGTNGHGVDLFMADGGFSVEGKENLQEILSKRLYLCQFLAGLSTLRHETTMKTPDGPRKRSGGNFFCKLFDIFTPFSVGLVYLMYVAFRRISLHKPHTSRPANSERYIIGHGLTEIGATVIKDYLTRINDRLEELKNQKSEDDILHIIPLDLIRDDRSFEDYLVKHNESLALRQTQYLDKYRIFAKNATAIDMDQSDLREKCLAYWKVPNLPKVKAVGQRDNLSPDLSLRRLCPQLEYTEMSIFSRRPAAFSEELLTASDSPTRRRSAEYRLTVLSERDSAPALLLGLGRQSDWIFSHQAGWVKCEYFIRLPRATVLLVQLTKRYLGTVPGKSQPANERKVVRILDAALLNGDDISGLRYSCRMAAVKKFCQALNVERTQPQYALLVAAETFRFDQIDDKLKRRFAITRIKGAEQAIIYDNDETGNYYICNGMRVISVVAEPWMMVWSKGHHMYYLFNKATNMSIYEKDITPAHESTESFWSVLMSGKQRDGTVASRDKQWTWSWTTTVSGPTYGPKTILEDDNSAAGLTFRSIQNLVKGGLA